MALMETLQDDFTSGTIDTGKWTNVTSGVSIVSGRLQLVDSTGAYPFASSAASYDIRNSYAFAQVTPAPRSGGNSQQTYFAYYASGGNGFGLAVGDTTLYKVTWVGGTETDTAIATYSATTHAWWRIRHNGTNIVLGWSADGVTWTEGTPFASPVTLGTTGWLNLNVGRWQAGDTATGYFDNVNIAPSTSKSGSDTASGVDSAGTVKFTGTDTGTGTEAVSSRTIADTEASSGADNAGTVKLTGSDTGTGTDSAGSAAVGWTGTDTATGTDNAGTLTASQSGTDTGTGTDSAGTLTASQSGTDTGTGTDSSGNLTQTKSGSDTASGADSAGSVATFYNLGGTDTGSGTDSAGALTASQAGTDTGTGTDSGTVARSSSSSDTATGTDSSGALTQKYSGAPDTATGTDNAGTIVTQQYSGSETATAAEAVTNRTLNGAAFNEPVTSVEAQTLTNLAAVPKSGADTVSRTEAQTLYLPGSFTQIPSPKTWSNGDSLDAGTLNKEWRDTFNWLLRKTSPAFEGYNLSTPTLSSNVAIPITTDDLTRGNLVHAASDTKVYVWEPGWYVICVQCGLTLTSVTGTNFATAIKVNGLLRSSGDATRVAGNAMGMAHQASVYLTPGDYVEMAVTGSWSGTLTAGGSSMLLPMISIWWRNN
jgi:hypothetical protein